MGGGRVLIRGLSRGLQSISMQNLHARKTASHASAPREGGLSRDPLRGWPCVLPLVGGLVLLETPGGAGGVVRREGVSRVPPGRLGC